MTPPTQQSDVDEAIESLELLLNKFNNDGSIKKIELFAWINHDAPNLLKLIHRLRLERGIAVGALKYCADKNNWDESLDVATKTLQKLGEKV